MKHVRFAATKDGHPVSLDIQRLIETRLLIQSNSGGGKSYALRKFLEVTHGHVQHLVLDVEGEFNSLRKEFEYVYVAKGEKVEPDPRSAAQLATMLLELGTSAIVDIYELPPTERRRFVHLFVDAIVDAPKKLWHPLMVVIDEAHDFAPEGKPSEALEAIVGLETKGRKRDYCGVLATQRFSKLNKDAAAELQNKIMGLANFEIDRVRSGDELGFSKHERLKLRDLEPGEMYITGPAFFIGDKRVKEPVLVQIDQVKTPHGRKAKAWHAPKAAQAGKIQKALAALAALPKRAEEEAKTVADLQRQLRDVKRELAEARRGVPKKDPKLIEEAQALRARVSELEKAMKNVGQLKSRLASKLSELGILIGQLPEGLAEPVPRSSQNSHVPILVRHRAEDYIKGPVDADRGDRKFGKADRAMLNLFLIYDIHGGKPLTKAQIAGWTGYSLNSSTFSNALSNLRAAGLVHGSADHLMLVKGKFEEASAILGPEFDPDLEPSIDQWEQKLGKAPREFFRILRQRQGEIVTKEELSELTGYSVGSSTFSNGLSDLCAKKLARREHGGIKLNEELL